MGNDDEGVEAGRALLLAQDAVLRAIESDVKQAQVIPLTWYDVLLELNATPQRRLRMADLAARTVLSRTRVSRLVDELVAVGLVKRAADPDDGRAAFAVLTGEGRTALRKTAPVYLAGIKHHFTDPHPRQDRHRPRQPGHYDCSHPVIATQPSPSGQVSAERRICSMYSASAPRTAPSRALRSPGVYYRCPRRGSCARGC